MVVEYIAFFTVLKELSTPRLPLNTKFMSMERKKNDKKMFEVENQKTKTLDLFESVWSTSEKNLNVIAQNLKVVENHVGP